MIVFHGSCYKIEQPKIINSNRALDFGEGFYTTSNFLQAKKWAQRVSYRNNDTHKIVNKYDFDFDHAVNKLNVLIFNTADEKWLDFVCLNRQNKYTGDYDIAIGPVADDQVYKVIVQYENGYIDKLETLKRLKTEQLTDQILFHTERSLEYLTFISSEDS